MPKIENLVAVGGAVFGGSLIAVSVFMPIAERTGPFAYIQENTLIQHGGWLILVAGIGVAATAVRAAIGKEKPWWPIVSSLIAGAFVLRVITNDKLRTLYPLNSDGEPDATVGGIVAPLGLAGYVAGVGAAIALISAVVLFSQRQDSGSKQLVAQWAAEDAAEEAAQDAAKHKQCPDCAETVLAAARVCKHCGFRFNSVDQPTTKSVADPSSTQVRCPNCTHPVWSDATICKHCGNRLANQGDPA